jgi:hypothetical protein
MLVSYRVALVVDDKASDADFAYYRPGVLSVPASQVLPGECCCECTSRVLATMLFIACDCCL